MVHKDDGKELSVDVPSYRTLQDIEKRAIVSGSILDNIKDVECQDMILLQ